MHNNANIPMEMIESDMPLTFLGYGLLTDSAAPAGIAAASGCGASGASIARRRSSRPISTASSSARSASTAASRPR